MTWLKIPAMLPIPSPAKTLDPDAACARPETRLSARDPADPHFLSDGTRPPGRVAIWYTNRLNGAWRSLVAHLLWEQGVAGSNPAAPTSAGRSGIAPVAQLDRASVF